MKTYVCDELKDYDIMDVEAYDDKRLEDSESGRIQVTRVYMKHDVDAAITELKAENERLVKCCKEYDSRQRIDERIKFNGAQQLRRHKYKRCLAMAELCNARYDEEDAKVNGCWASWEYISNKMKYWERWRWRWDALAEKFKEAK